MAVIAKTVTISPEQERFLAESKFSPSKLLQQAIEALMFSYNPTDLKTLIQIEKDKSNRIMENLQNAMAFLDKKGLLGEFSK